MFIAAIKHTLCAAATKATLLASSKARLALRVGLLSAAVASAQASTIDLGSLTPGLDGIQLDNGVTSKTDVCVSSAGDVNGDGYADVIIGLPHTDNNSRSESGSSYVIFGKTSGLANLTLATLSGSDGFRIDGAAANDHAGISVSSAGDVNGDGYGDIIIGADQTGNIVSPGTGASFVIFGKASGFSTIDLASLTTATGFRMDGEASGDRFGNGVSSAGDINGDGYADVIIGAWVASHNSRPSSGSSYVVFGKASGFANINMATAALPAVLRIDGETGFDESGFSVSSAGDVNGDGYSDMIIGAQTASYNSRSSSGSSYVVLGKSTWSTNVDLASLTATDGFRIDGAATTDQVGRIVASAGDINGDGYADVIVSASNASNNSRANSGSGYVIFGKASGFATIDLLTASLPDMLRIDGALAGDFIGQSVACGGDVNGDGYADVIISGTGADNNSRSNSGSSYVIFGKPSGLANIDLANFGYWDGIRIDGAVTLDRAGHSVSSAGDVNGDGYSDLVIGNYNGLTASNIHSVIFGGRAARTYLAHTPAGDAPRVPIGAMGKDGAPVSAVSLNFDGGAALSTETVTMYTLGRSVATGLSPLNDINDAIWEIATTRTGWTNCAVTIKYPASARPFQSDLKIYQATNPAGPWTRLATIVDTTRQEATATSAAFPSYFALGKSNVLPLGLSRFGIE